MVDELGARHELDTPGELHPVVPGDEIADGTPLASPVGGPPSPVPPSWSPVEAGSGQPEAPRARRDRPRGPGRGAGRRRGRTRRGPDRHAVPRRRAAADRRAAAGRRAADRRRGRTSRSMPGASLGIVGESGSGKTMLCRSFIGTLPRYGVAITGGRLLIAGARHDARDRAGLAADPRARDRVRAAELAGGPEPGADGRDAAARGAPHRAAQPVGVAGARGGTPAARPRPDPARGERSSTSARTSCRAA